MFQLGPIRGCRRRDGCYKDWPVFGSITESASRDHWLPCRTSEEAHSGKNSDGKVRIEAAKGDNLRQELVRCYMGVGGSPGVGTAGN